MHETRSIFPPGAFNVSDAEQDYSTIPGRKHKKATKLQHSHTWANKNWANSINDLDAAIVSTQAALSKLRAKLLHFNP